MTMLSNPRVRTAAMTCSACPVQIEGQLVDGSYFYFRYRGGRAQLGLADSPDAAVEHTYRDAPTIRFGDALQGVFESDEDMNAVFDRLLAMAREEQ